jgi:hypothetical protein
MRPAPSRRSDPGPAYVGILERQSRTAYPQHEDCNHPIDRPYTIEFSKDSRCDLVTPKYSTDKHSRKIVVVREDR